MKIVQYNKMKKYINLYNNYEILGFTDKLYISGKLNYLRTPKCLFKYNLNLFINLNKFINNNYKDIIVLAYKGYLITNNIINNKEFIHNIKLNKLNSLIINIIIYYIWIIINLLKVIIIKLLLVKNYNSLCV